MVDVLVKDALEAFVAHPKDMFKQLEEIFDRTVERAVAAERERCAKIAEDENLDWGPVGVEIAAAIRKGEPCA